MTFFSRRTLVRLLIAKAVVEALLVTGLAAGFYSSTASRSFRGALEHADAKTISGWAVDDENPDTRVEVQLFVNDRFIAQQAASAFRPDIHQSQTVADDWHGFAFTTPALAPGEHEARVYVVHTGKSPARRVLQLIGQPMRFLTDPQHAQ